MEHLDQTPGLNYLNLTIYYRKSRQLHNSLRKKKQI